MAGKMSSMIHHKNAVPWILALTIAYQLAYHTVMHRALQHAQEPADDECSASGGSLAETPLCIEVQMFRTWQQTAPLWHELEAGLLPESAVVDDLLQHHLDSGNASVGSASGAAAASPEGAHSRSRATASTTPFTADVASTTPAASSSQGVAWSPITQWAQGLMDLQSNLEAKFHAAAARHSHARPTISSHSVEAAGIMPWGQQIVDLQKELEAHREALPSVRRKHAQEPVSEFDRLASELEARLNSSMPPSPWAGQLLDLQTKLQSQLDALAASHAAKEAAHSARVRGAGHQQGGTPTPTPVDGSLLDHAEELHRQLCEAPERRHRKVCVDYLAAIKAAGHAARLAADTREMHEHLGALQHGLANVATEHAAWEHHFDEEVHEVLLELCGSPHRQDTEECRELRQKVEEAERRKAAAHRAARAALRANITAETQKRTAALERKLREMRQEHRLWEEALLERNGLGSKAAEESSGPGVAADTSTATQRAAKKERTSLRQGQRLLLWSKVAAWAGNKRRDLGDRGAFVVKLEDLRGPRWTGSVPKVVCISAIPDGHQAQSKMAYFVNNFRLQDYEGQKQLVLVYNQKDLAAARLAKQYADGSQVKAVAAWGEGAFPSTAALRFGAWLAPDAQVVARWDFDTWHHPQRLSLQVRALAFSTRPGCLLKQHVSADASEAVSAEASLVGEAAWMREFWHPLLEQERGVLQAARARDIVELELESSYFLMSAAAGHR